MEIKTLVKRSFKCDNAELMAEKEKKLRKEHEKLVKGMFEFVDAQGGWLDFSYRWFRGEDIKTIRLIHGEICELPLGIVRHLNNTYKKIRTMTSSSPDKAVSDTVRGVPTTCTKQSRVRFTPMEALS